MIEILVIILVVRAFSRTAAEKNLNKVLWGIIGALSYYIPVLVFGFVILPSIVESGTLGDGIGMLLLSVLINITVGAITCFIAYQVLKSQDARVDPNATGSPFDAESLNRDLNR